MRKISGFDAGLTSDNNFSQHKEKLMANPMRNRLPLNALRAFESSARHLNFTRAGLELSVTQPPSANRCARWRNSWAFSCFVACRAAWI